MEIFFENSEKSQKGQFFYMFLKMDFELHVYCREYDLSDITNWQHIGGGPSGRNFCRNFCLPLVPELNFHLWRRFFFHFDKINNFRQQKQLLLFLSHMQGVYFNTIFFWSTFSKKWCKEMVHFSENGA